MPVAAQEDADGGFSDVLEGVHTPAIKALDALGVLEGTECAEGLFCPDDEMQRSTMAVWLVRALDEAEPAAVSESRFADVDTEAWWLAHVERLAELEVTRGCLVDPLRFCPDRSVTRAEMAAFLVRTFDLESADTAGFTDTAESADPAGFTDTAGTTHETDIDTAAAAGLIERCETEPLRYCPDRPVPRAQAATFLARALGLPKIPPTTVFAAVSTGWEHACGLGADGTIVCWGDDSQLQCAVPGGTYTAVRSGVWHTCGLRTGGSAVCWGDNEWGQADAPEGFFTSVSSGARHSCGVGTGGTVACWGSNADGSGTHTGQADPPAGTFSTVDAGSWHTCGVSTDGTVACWGANADGQSDAPSGTFAAVSAGWYHSCGLRVDGTVSCWGANQWLGSHAGQSEAPTGTFSAVTVGMAHSCGLRTDGTVACWGSDLDSYGNYRGQTQALTGIFTAIDSHLYRVCGLRPDGTIECWGSGAHE